MMYLLSIISVLGHSGFFLTVVLDHSPPSSDSLFQTSDAVKLLAIQFVGAITTGFCVYGESDLGPAVARFMILPILGAHGYGFTLWRRRADAPRGTPACRAVEDVMYTLHGLLAAVVVVQTALR